MILLADSGSTHTHWVLFSTKEKRKDFITSGINPYYQSSEEIETKLSMELDLSEQECEQVDILYFYGAGCGNDEKKSNVRQALKCFFEKAHISIENDLLGAARSLFGSQYGIACILGTGSNSCFYNGLEIEKNIPPLGFLLGDEGSGAILGKQLVADYLKGIMPIHLRKLFSEKYKSELIEVMNHVYHQSFPNRYLASFAPFLVENKEDEYVQSLIENAFKSFFERNVMQYDYTKYPIGFIGSIAVFFSEELKAVAAKYYISIHQICQDPIEGLLEYHLQ